MSARPPSLLHQRLIAVLAFALLLAGVGQGLTDASASAGPSFGPPGLAAPICHAGGRTSPRPGGIPRHDCCDACVLLGAAVPAPGPPVIRPKTVVHAVPFTTSVDRSSAAARQRTPRQSQAPPVAVI